MTTVPISTRFSAAFAAARITWTLLQFLAPLGGAASVPAPAAAHAAASAAAAAQVVSAP